MKKIIRLFMSATLLLAGGVSCSSDDAETIAPSNSHDEKEQEDTLTVDKSLVGKWQWIKSENSNGDITDYESNGWYIVFSPDGKYTTEGHGDGWDATEEFGWQYTYDDEYYSVNTPYGEVSVFKYQFLENGDMQCHLYDANYNLGVAWGWSLDTYRRTE